MKISGGEIALLFGVAVVQSIIYLPKGMMRLLGFCYQAEFMIDGRKVCRPAWMSSRAHKAAFEDLGRYITNALTRDVMISYRDRDLRQESFLRPSKVPLEVWHQVLEYFAEEGCIEERWELHTDLEPYSSSPRHAPNGEALEKRKDSVIAGEIPNDEGFNPGLLTPDQRREIIGKPYRVHDNDILAKTKTDDWYARQYPNPEQTVITPAHLTRIFVRNRRVLSHADNLRGAETLATILSVDSK